MTDSSLHAPAEAEPTPGELLSALFMSLVMQQTNLALMLLGRVPNPETGKTATDLDGARLFIDQLEMLGQKTRGNLSEAETRLLKQSLTTLHLAFAEAVDHPGGAPSAGPAAPAQPTSPASQDASAQDPESRKRFTKTY